MNFTEALISAVQEMPVLYDTSLNGNHDPKLKDRAWFVISKRIGQTMDRCRNRWRSFCNRLLKEFNERESHKSSPKLPPLWCHYSKMMFFWQFLNSPKKNVERDTPESILNKNTRSPSDFDKVAAAQARSAPSILRSPVASTAPIPNGLKIIRRKPVRMRQGKKKNTTPAAT